MSVQVQHLQSKAENYSTVSKFTFHNQNRPVNQAHVRELIGKIYDKNSGSWNMSQEITVNKKTGNLCDGQHRYSAWIQLMTGGMLPADSKLNVHYVEVNPEDELEYITSLQDAKHWTYKTFIESALKGGDSNMINLDRWCRQHSLCCKTNVDGTVNCSYRYGAAILTGKGGRNFKTISQMVITPEMETFGNIIHDEIKEIIAILRYTPSSANIEALAPAWTIWRAKNPDITFSEWKSMMKRRVKSIRPSTIGTLGQKVWENYFALIYSNLV